MQRTFCWVVFLLISLLINPLSAIALDSVKMELLIEQEQRVLVERQQEIIVQYKEGMGRASIDNISNVVRLTNDIEVLRIKDDSQVQHVLWDLEQNDNVAHVEINRRLYLPNINNANGDQLTGLANTKMNDTYYHSQWWLPAVNAPAAWTVATPKKPVVVAVIDSGIELTHEDLTNRIVPGGYNFISNSSEVYDVNGHGTAVAGVIAAESGNYIGICGVAGSWDIKVLPLQAAYYDGSLYTSDVIKAIDYAIARGVDVINMSFGSTNYSWLEEQAIQRAVDKGIVVVASAGNDGTRQYEYPASYDNVISVGSIALDGFVSTFSNYNDGVDFVAPGEKIATTFIQNDYRYAEGTSFSAPIVSGVAGMIKAMEPTLTPMQVRDKLANSAIDKGKLGKDNYYGYGLVDAHGTIKTMATVPPVSDNEHQIWPAQTDVAVNKVWTVAFNQQLKADTVDNKNIFVTDAAGNLINVEVRLNYDGKSVLISPTTPYQRGKTYYLHIKTTVQSTVGSVLKKPFKMEFKIIN